MTDAAPPPPTDLKNTLEELRASVAARGARKGLRGAIQEAILGFLECLLALLADFRAGRLAPVSDAPETAGRGTAHCQPRAFTAEDAEKRGDAMPARRAAFAGKMAEGARHSPGFSCVLSEGFTAEDAEIRCRLAPGRWRKAPGIRRAFPPYEMPCARGRRRCPGYRSRAGPLQKTGSGRERIFVRISLR